MESLKGMGELGYDSHRKAVEAEKIRQSAIGTRAALNFLAYEANPSAIGSAFRIKKDTPRGAVSIQVNPVQETQAEWTQTEVTRESITKKAYFLGIDENGNMNATATILERRMNEPPLRHPISIKIGPGVLYIGGKYPSWDRYEFDRIEKRLARFDSLPQVIQPNVEFLDGLRRDLLRSQAPDAYSASPVAISGSLQAGEVIDFPISRIPLAETG